MLATTGQGRSTTPLTATSNDGGKTWTTHRLPERIGQLTDLACGSPTECVTIGGTQLGNWLRGKILATADGGRTWTSSKLPAGVGALYGVSCPTAHFCLAVGTSVEETSPIALRTRNRGTSWQRLSVPSGLPQLGTVACASSKRCLVLAVGQTQKGNEELNTNDGGDSWTKTSALLGFTGGGAVSCPSLTNCIIAERSSRVRDLGPTGLSMETTDAGASWSELKLPTGTGPLVSISCHTPTFCMAVGGSISELRGCVPCVAPIVTKSGAVASWVPQTPPDGVSGGLSSVSCHTALDCVTDGQDLARTPEVVLDR